MRAAAVHDFIQLIERFQIDHRATPAIDIGGTDKVYLEGEIRANPLKELCPEITFLDKGFNEERIGAHSEESLDFLDKYSIGHLVDKHRLVLCFDVLEHVPNPFLFCEHLIDITRPGGYIYAATVFEWQYHPSPEDYFRFSPTGMTEIFQNTVNASRSKFKPLATDWASDKKGVYMLGQRL